MANYLLGLDIGTSAAHCALADERGNLLHAASAPMRYFTPEGFPPNAREIGPRDLLEALCQLVERTLAPSVRNARQVAAIGVTSQRQGMVFLDRSGRELYAGPTTDLRAVFEGLAIDGELKDTVYQTTGHLPSLMFAPARLRWFQLHTPRLAESVAVVAPLASWLACRLTGNLACEYAHAGELGMLDVKTRQPCRALLSSLGLPEDLLPPLVAAGTPVGCLTEQMAKGWGLPAGIPVALAGPDTQCGLLGMGVASPGSTGIVLGWSGCIQRVTAQPSPDTTSRTWFGCHAVDHLWVAESNLGDSGYAFHRLKQLLLGEEASYDQVEALAGQVEAGCEGALAFLGPGPQSMSQAGLRLGGVLFPTPLSFQNITPGHLLRSAMENVAFAVKANLAILEEVTGSTSKLLCVGGGMARSRLIPQIIASVLGREVKSTTPDVSVRGACLAAAVAAGLSPSLSQAAQVVLDSLEAVEPDPSLAADYQDSYQRWLQTYNRLQAS